ncbi:uncharacterized protein [Struthio camelus]|uniref:uncharacterized protein n=1 Tax=Struthio camelus TaxID=8801 RepID=UPI003603C3AE
MAPAAGLLLACFALAAPLQLHQDEPGVFAEPGGTAELHCSFRERLESGRAVRWYLRRDGGPPALLLRCDAHGGEPRHQCKHQHHRSSLRIRGARTTDSGVYYCAYIVASWLVFSDGCSLVVGDSWRAGSWVRLLGPRGAAAGGRLACAVGAAGGAVLVSWRVPPGSRLSGPPRELRAPDGSTTLISHVAVAPEAGREAEVACEVRFNASGPGVRRSARLRAAACQPSAALYGLAAGGALLLLSVTLSIMAVLRRSPPATACRSAGCSSAALEPQATLVYAQLDFAAAAHQR